MNKPLLFRAEPLILRHLAGMMRILFTWSQKDAETCKKKRRAPHKKMEIVA